MNDIEKIDTAQPLIIYASDNFGGETWAWATIEEMQAEWDAYCETVDDWSGEYSYIELELGDDGLYYDGKNEGGYTWQANGQLDYNI